MPIRVAMCRWRAREDIGMTLAYCATFREVFETSARRFLFNIAKDDLLKRNPIIVAIVDNGCIVSGLTIDIDGLNEAYIGSVITHPSKLGHGYASRTLDYALAIIRNEHSLSVAKLTIRIERDGRPNPVIKLFQEKGFQSGDEKMVQISGHYADEHLRESAEADGKTFRIRWMRADLTREIT